MATLASSVGDRKECAAEKGEEGELEGSDGMLHGKLTWGGTVHVT